MLLAQEIVSSWDHETLVEYALSKLLQEYETEEAFQDDADHYVDRLELSIPEKAPKMTPQVDLNNIDPGVLERAKARATEEVRHCDKNRETLARHILKYRERSDLVFYAVEYLMQAYRDDPSFFTEEVERVLGEDNQDPVEFVLDTDEPTKKETITSKPVQTSYMWKIRWENGQYVTPHADPMKYENAVDYFFPRPHDAKTFLLEEELEEEAAEEKWVLVKVTYEPVETKGKQ